MCAVGDFSTFRISFSKVTSDIASTGLGLKSESILHRALQALELPSNDRMAVLSAMNLQSNHNCPKSLRMIAHRLSARPIKAEDVLLESQTDEWEITVDLEYSYVAKSKVNRPGYEAAAIKGAQRQMSYPNSDNSGKYQEKECYVFDSDQRIEWLEIATFLGLKRQHSARRKKIVMERKSDGIVSLVGKRPTAYLEKEWANQLLQYNGMANRFRTTARRQIMGGSNLKIQQ